jgi:DNA-binding transcriptional ArsR family regulator
MVPYAEVATGSSSDARRKGHCYRASGHGVSIAQALPHLTVALAVATMRRMCSLSPWYSRMRTFTARTVTTSADAPARTDIPRTPRLNREQREAWVMALYLGGATVEEIAFVLGSGRTSVRQCVMEAGLGRHRSAKNIDVLAILREVRRSGTISLKEVAARIGYSEETVRHSVAALGMSESVRRLFRLRRRTARRVAAANADLPVKAVPIRPIGARRTLTVRVA